MADSEATPVQAPYDNRRTALLYVSRGTEEADKLTGYYRDEEGEQYRITGSMTSERADFRIVDEDSGETVGECFARPHATPPRNPKAPIATGKLTFRGESYGIAVRPAEFNSGMKGYTIFPDAMPAQINGRW